MLGRALKQQLAAIERLLWTGISAWAVTRTEARQVFQIFRALPDDVALGGVVRRLEAKGLVDRWLRSMPEKELYERANGDVAVFIRILSFRPPDAAIKQAIKLLSIRSLPPDAQRDFKVRDNGKWFVRLERNLTQTDDSHLVRRGLNVAFVSSEKLASGLLSLEAARRELRALQPPQRSCRSRGKLRSAVLNDYERRCRTWASVTRATSCCPASS